MCKVKERALGPDGEIQNDLSYLVEETYTRIEYSRLFKHILLRLLSNPAMVGDETPTASEYTQAAADLTKAALAHLNAKHL